MQNSVYIEGIDLVDSSEYDIQSQLAIKTPR